MNPSKALIAVLTVVIVEIAAVAGIYGSWVTGALQAARETQNLPCRNERDIARAASGKLSQREMDAFVVRQANMTMGQTSHLRWHIRGLAILGPYLVFWPQDARRDVFAEIVSRMEPCSSLQGEND